MGGNGAYVVLAHNQRTPDEDTQKHSGHHDTHRVRNGGGQVQAFGGLDEVGHRHRGHEGGGQSRDETGLGRIPVSVQEHGAGPQHDHRQRLVGPGEVTPQHVPRQRQGNDGAHTQQRDGQRGTGPTVDWSMWNQSAMVRRAAR